MPAHINTRKKRMRKLLKPRKNKENSITFENENTIHRCVENFIVVNKYILVE